MADFWGWLTRYAWLAWAILAGALAVLELFTLDLTLLMLAAGAGAGCLTALVVPSLWWVQVLVAVIVAFLTLALLRPTLLRRIREAPGYRSSTDSLVGSTGVATAQITRLGGEVKVDGQIWEARPYDPDISIEAGDRVDILDRDGLTLLVYRADQ